MRPHDIRQQLHRLLDRHADVLAAIRASRVQMDAAFKASDEAVGAAIDANDAALTLLTCLMDEGVEGEP